MRTNFTILHSFNASNFANVNIYLCFFKIDPHVNGKCTVSGPGCRVDITVIEPMNLNPLALKKLGSVFSKLILGIHILRTFYEINVRWMPQNPTDDKSALVQVMIWCRQATSHYLSQFDPHLCCHMALLVFNELIYPISLTLPGCINFWGKPRFLTGHVQVTKYYM